MVLVEIALVAIEIIVGAGVVVGEILSFPVVGESVGVGVGVGSVGARGGIEDGPTARE